MAKFEDVKRNASEATRSTGHSIAYRNDNDLPKVSRNCNLRWNVLHLYLFSPLTSPLKKLKVKNFTFNFSFIFAFKFTVKFKGEAKGENK